MTLFLYTLGTRNDARAHDWRCTSLSTYGCNRKQTYTSGVCNKSHSVDYVHQRSHLWNATDEAKDSVAQLTSQNYFGTTSARPSCGWLVERADIGRFAFGSAKSGS